MNMEEKVYVKCYTFDLNIKNNEEMILRTNVLMFNFEYSKKPYNL